MTEMATRKSALEAKPRALWIATIIAAAQLYRVNGPFTLATGFLPSYLAPNAYGDLLIGITAVPVALTLWRASLLRWAIGAAWFAFSIADSVYGVPSWVMNGGILLIPIALLLNVSVNISGLLALLSRSTRDYVASRNRQER